MKRFLEKLRRHIGREWGSRAPAVTRWLGGRLRQAEPGALTLEFVVRPDMANPLGALHGGVQTAIMDDVIGLTVATLERPNFFVTLTLNVDYLGSVRVGETFFAQARIIREGQRIINAQCELVSAAGDLISRGTSNLLASRLALAAIGKKPPPATDR